MFSQTQNISLLLFVDAQLDSNYKSIIIRHIIQYYTLEYVGENIIGRNVVSSLKFSENSITRAIDRSIRRCLPLRTTGPARRKSRAAEESEYSRSHGDDDRTRILYCVSLLSYGCCSVLGFRSFSLFRIPSTRRKTPRKRRSTEKLWRSFHERWTRPSHSTILLLEHSHRSVALSLSLSFHLPPSSQLSRTTIGTCTIPLFARVHRVSVSRDLYSRKIAASWAPLLPDRPWITRSKSVRYILASYALPSLRVSLRLHNSSCTYTNLAVLIYPELIPT